MNYRIGKDTHSWTIEQQHVHTKDSKSPGKVEWRTIKWYPTLFQAALSLQRLAEQDAYKNATEDIGDLLHAVVQARGAVISYLKNEL